MDATTPEPAVTPAPSSSPVAAPRASEWDARVERLSERLNPIIVKEVRQGLRTRIFWICFGLMLAACFVISLVAYGTSLEGSMSSAGQGFFFSYFVCLSIVQFFVIPYSAYRSLAREREDETWVLLSLTGIGAKRIIRGKLGSFLAQALLYASAVLPFLLFSYYLNGIDLPTILAVVTLGAAYTIFLTAISVCAATLAETRLFRGLVHFAVLGVLLVATGTGLSLAGAITFEGSRLTDDDEFLIAVIAGLWVMLSFGNLLYQAAAARLALPTEDYAKGPRIAVLIQVLGSLPLLVWGWEVSAQDHEVPMIAQLILQADLFVIGVFLMSGVDPVHEVHYAKKGFPLFRPGSLRAFRLVVLLVLLCSVCWVVLFELSSGHGRSARFGLQLIIGAAAYTLIYLSLPVVIARMTGIPALNGAAGLRILALALAVFASGMPPVIALLLGMRPEDPIVNLFNPIVGTVNFVDRMRGDPRGGVELLTVVCVAAFLLALAADMMLGARERHARKLRADGLRAVGARS